MEHKHTDLFLLLLQLKSYLVSMIDTPEKCAGSFNFTEEFLQRRYPELEIKILDLLQEQGLNDDCDIIFDERAHIKFQEIVRAEQPQLSLEKIIEKSGIDSSGIEIINNYLSKYQSTRDRNLQIIIGQLFQIIKAWAHLQIAEEKFDELSALLELDVIRKSETEELEKVGEIADSTHSRITSLSHKYLKMLSDYYFDFGGNIELKNFIDQLELFKKDVEKKYAELFEVHGLNNESSPNDNNSK